MSVRLESLVGMLRSPMVVCRAGQAVLYSNVFLDRVVWKLLKCVEVKEAMIDRNKTRYMLCNQCMDKRKGSRCLTGWLC